MTSVRPTYNKLFSELMDIIEAGKTDPETREMLDETGAAMAQTIRAERGADDPDGMERVALLTIAAASIVRISIIDEVARLDLEP